MANPHHNYPSQPRVFSSRHTFRSVERLSEPSGPATVWKPNGDERFAPFLLGLSCFFFWGGGAVFANQKNLLKTKIFWICRFCQSKNLLKTEILGVLPFLPIKKSPENGDSGGFAVFANQKIS